METRDYDVTLPSSLRLEGGPLKPENSPSSTGRGPGERDCVDLESADRLRGERQCLVSGLHLPLRRVQAVTHPLTQGVGGEDHD